MLNMIHKVLIILLAMLFIKDQYNGLLAMLQQRSVGIGESSTPSNGINMIHASSHHVISGSRCFSLHATATSHISVPWLFDTGATHHICCNLDLYTSHARITSMNINLPNGHTVVAHFAGTVRLTHLLTLDRVLFIPQFAINLISVSRHY
jgi:hypothetical protein